MRRRRAAVRSLWGVQRGLQFMGSRDQSAPSQSSTEKDGGASSGQTNEYSSRITRQIMGKAEEMFGQTLEGDKLNPLLNEVVQGSHDLEESERKQLEEIANLLTQSDGEGATDGSLDCAGDFELEPTDDQMFLLLRVRPPVAGGYTVQAEDVLDALKSKGISMGVDIKAIRRACDQAANGKEVSDVAVVNGRYPKPGTDARIERYGRHTADGTPEPLTDKDLATGEPLLCMQGDVVMRYIPPGKGEDGFTALGETLPPPEPSDVEPSAGKNVQRHGNDFVADVTGVAIFDGNSVETRKALVLHKDLTHQSDPIDFDGDVQINGSVRSGAKVRATGNITVSGNVEAAEVESVEGDITLRSGVAGRNIAVIRAGRDVTTRFAESANILAARDITLQVGSLHSRLIAYRNLNAVQGKGHIGGGVVMAGEKVNVKQLGARGGVPTQVTVGLSEETLKGLSHNDKLAARARERREHCADLTNQIERAVGNPAKLSKKELTTYTKLRQLQVVCDVQIRKLAQQRRQILAEGHRDYGGRVAVQVSIMPGVEIHIGDAEMDAENMRGPVTLLYDDNAGQITTRPGV